MAATSNQKSNHNKDKSHYKEKPPINHPTLQQSNNKTP